MRTVLIAGGFFVALILFILCLEVRSSLTLVAGRGGLWLRYATGFWGCPLVGVQLRWMMGYQPRVWLELPWLRRPRRASPKGTFGGLKGKKGKLKPIHIPAKAITDMVSRFHLLRFDFRLKLGVPDNAAVTALLCASALSAAHGARGVLSRHQAAAPAGQVCVQPVFSSGALQLRFACILAVKARHIIWELVKVYATGRKKDGNTSD
jgi:hypothetical protein